MCLAIPMKIESIQGGSAIAEAAGSRIKVNIVLLDDIKIGDYVLVHAGFAIRKIDEEEAAKTINALNELAEGK